MRILVYKLLIRHNFDFISNNAGKKRSELQEEYEKVIYVD